MILKYHLFIYVIEVCTCDCEALLSRICEEFLRYIQLPVLHSFFRMLKYLSRISIIVLGFAVIVFLLVISGKMKYHQREECVVTKYKNLNNIRRPGSKDVEQITEHLHSYSKETLEITPEETLERDINGLQENDGHIKLGSSSPAYKIYIYDLPPQFNYDAVVWLKEKCYDTSAFGYGKTFATADGITFRNTWQGTLEETIHHRLLRSSLRTMDPEQADVFYIPYYAEMEHRHTKQAFHSKIMEYLYRNITIFPYFAAGKPHFSTIGWPEMFYGIAEAPSWIANILYIVLEVAHRVRARNPKKWYYNTLVAPYQAIGHFTQKNGGVHMDMMLKKQRRVFVFFAGASRGSNKTSESQDFRNKVVNQFPITTNESFTTYYTRSNTSTDDAIMFLTVSGKGACDVRQSAGIVQWMQNSVFCLQPAGDSATRKSFYDSIISGCIPILFETPHIPTRVKYPFDTKIDYNKFTVFVPQNRTFTEVLDPYKHSTDGVKKLQKNLARIAKYLQYNDVTTPDVDVDAFHLLLDQVGEHFGFVDKTLLV